MFRIPAETPMTPQLLEKYIGEQKKLITNRYQKLHDAYIGKYRINELPRKESYKPDNRIPVNFAKYLTDTFNGFFIGNPIKTTSDDEEVSAYVEFLDQYNDQDNNNAELAKICSIYGSGYEMYYVDDSGNVAITYLDPMRAFMIYDESIEARPLYFIQFYTDSEGVERGSWSDGQIVQRFYRNAGYRWEDEYKEHGFDGVPATEYVENEEDMSLFESALPLIDAYNKAISEKANDVDYFADAYLKILGAKLEEEDLIALRRNRLINFSGEDTDKLVVDFLQKPNADATQENLLATLERLIYQTSMVANISDENFGTSSGIALKYKLLNMTNLAKVKERKFTSGMNRRYRLIFSNPVNQMSEDAWVSIKYQFTPNLPANLLEEAQIAAQLAGITSRETQLKVISAVDNVQEEIDRIESEQDMTGYMTDYPTNRIDEGIEPDVNGEI